MNAVSQPAGPLLAERQTLAMKGFFAIMAHWGADNATARRILGSPAERTFYAWKRGKVARLPEGTLRRIGYVAGIWKALQIVYSQAHLADSWAARQNDYFGRQDSQRRIDCGRVARLSTWTDC